MAVRPLVNIERLTTAYVNSVDGSMTYESGKAYKANTTVSYNGSLYTATVDIEDTDTDTPDLAPEKWSLTIGASDAGTSGDISALAARVTALEDDVKGIIIAKIHTIEVTAENDTVGSLLVKLYDALVADKNDQPSDYFHYVSTMTLPGYATLKNCGGNIRQHSSGISYNYFGARLPSQNEMDITFIEHKSPTTVIVMAKLSNAGTFTLGSVASETLTDGTKFSAIIEYYKQNE